MSQDKLQDTTLAKTKQRAQKQPRRARRGLLMQIIGLGLVIIAIVIIFQLSALMWGLWKEAQLNTQLTRINSTVERVWERRGDFPNANITETVVRRGGFTGSSVQGTAPNRQLVSPYNTNVVVSGQGGRSYMISVAELPGTACESILENFINDTTSIKRVVVAGTTITAPITQTDIDTKCTNQSDDKYTVVFMY